MYEYTLHIPYNTNLKDTTSLIHYGFTKPTERIRMKFCAQLGSLKLT